MFDSGGGVEHAITVGNSQSNDRHDRKPPKSDRKDFTSGVVGVSINRQGSNDEPGLDNTDDTEDVSILKAYNLVVSNRKTISIRVPENCRIYLIFW